MPMLSQKKIRKIINDIYREIYANAEPVGDWDKMLEEAEVNERGQKVIPYDDYVIEEGLMQKIIDKHMKNNKVSEYYQKSFNFEIWLGCSPRSKKKD
jgi:hypothetical protein